MMINYFYFLFFLLYILIKKFILSISIDMMVHITAIDQVLHLCRAQSFFIQTLGNAKKLLQIIT